MKCLTNFSTIYTTFRQRRPTLSVNLNPLDKMQNTVSCPDDAKGVSPAQSWYMQIKVHRESRFRGWFNILA